MILDQELHVRAAGLEMLEMVLEEGKRIKGAALRLVLGRAGSEEARVCGGRRRGGGGAEEEREQGGERIGHGEEIGSGGVEIRG